MENAAQGNQEGAEKDLLEALGYIKKSAAHESTANDPKTLMYMGKIYSEAVKLAPMAKNEALKAFGTQENMQMGLDAFKKSAANDTKGKYEDDITNYCGRERGLTYNSGVKLYEEEKV